MATAIQLSSEVRRSLFLRGTFDLASAGEKFDSHVGQMAESRSEKDNPPDRDALMRDLQIIEDIPTFFDTIGWKLDLGPGPHEIVPDLPGFWRTLVVLDNYICEEFSDLDESMIRLSTALNGSEFLPPGHAGRSRGDCLLEERYAIQQVCARAGRSL